MSTLGGKRTPSSSGDDNDPCGVAMAHEPVLTKEESAALEMLASTVLMKKTIPPKTLEKLLALKFVEEKVDGIVVTEKGTEILDRYSR
jgi:hypothetical protein